MLLLLAFSLTLCIRHSDAATSYTVSKQLNSTMKAQFAASYPPPAGCKTPGICVPSAPIVLPANTLWLWCGFSSTHRTYYVVTAVAPYNLTVLLVRHSDFRSYAQFNLSNFANTPVIANSLCDMSKGVATVCNNRTFGLVFYDEICLVATNSKTKPVTFTVQVINTYDAARHGGVIALICLTVASSILVLTVWAVNIWREIQRPIVSKPSPVSSTTEVSRFDGPAVPPASEPFTARVRRSIGGLFSSKSKAEAAVPQ